MAAQGLEHHPFAAEGLPPPGRNPRIPRTRSLRFRSRRLGVEHQEGGSPGLGRAAEQGPFVSQQPQGGAASIRPLSPARRMHRSGEALRRVSRQPLPGPLPQGPPTSHLPRPVAVQPTGPQPQLPGDCRQPWRPSPGPTPRPDQPPMQLLNQLQWQVRERSWAETPPEPLRSTPEPGRWDLNSNDKPLQAMGEHRDVEVLGGYPMGSRCWRQAGLRAQLV